MGKTYSLIVTTRNTVGHQAAQLRRSGKIPGTVYGKDMKSVSVELGIDAFTKIFKEAGETHVIDLSIDGSKYPVLIHDVQKNPVTREILNVEFYKVNLKEKLKTEVPVAITGESQVLKDGLGNLLTLLNTVEIEALPTDIPESFLVDISVLTEVDQEVKVKDITVPAGVTVLTDPDIAVVKIGALVVEAAPEQTTGEAPVEGEAAPETAPTEEAPKETEKTE